MSVLKNMSQNLINRRKALGLSKAELAEMSGVSVYSITKLEQGCDLSCSIGLSVCEALDVNPEDILLVTPGTKPLRAFDPQKAKKENEVPMEEAAANKSSACKL